MDESASYSNMRRLYKEYFSLGYLNTDINTKFALISLICYITEKLKKKKPDVTYYQVIYKLASNLVSEESIKGLAIMCEDFSYGCTQFPTFGIEDKDIPKKIREILHNWLPF